MPSIKRPSSSPSPSEVTRLEAVARRLNKAWSGLPAVEILRNAFADSAFIKNPVLVSSFGADSAVLLRDADAIGPCWPGIPGPNLCDLNSLVIARWLTVPSPASIYIYIYILYLYLYICICMYMHVCIYIYI